MAVSSSLLKRIDIGLFIGMMAVLVSFLALLTSKQQIEIAQATQKASVLPVIQIDMDYQYKTLPYSFKVMLTNSGPGIAYVQNVQPLIGDRPMANYKELQKSNNDWTDVRFFKVYRACGGRVYKFW
ncbi:MAG: hypothetical protein COA63_011410 [Methylophaga sp.]|nr:hypothetical protein [Methylophaga sp.]